MTTNDPVAELRRLADWLAAAKTAIAFTGAGVSTESGIPDFRSPGGVWARSQPVYFDEYLRSLEARLEYWRQKAETHVGFMAAAPNVTHTTLAEWETAGTIRGVITQNIDGLHQLAGSRNVLELHGTARFVDCLDCGHRHDADGMVTRFNASGVVPGCDRCGGVTKHATVSFGQTLPAAVLRESATWAGEADVFVVLGSSLVVEPAASLPRIAKERGAKLAIINRNRTPLDPWADVVLHAPLGETIARIRELLIGRRMKDER